MLHCRESFESSNGSPCWLFHMISYLQDYRCDRADARHRPSTSRGLLITGLSVSIYDFPTSLHAMIHLLLMPISARTVCLAIIVVEGPCALRVGDNRALLTSRVLHSRSFRLGLRRQAHDAGSEGGSRNIFYVHWSFLVCFRRHKLAHTRMRQSEDNKTYRAIDASKKVRNIFNSVELANALELNSAYVNVAVIRWQSFTGKTAILEATGESFDATAMARSAGSASSATKIAPPSKRRAGSSPRTSARSTAATAS